MEVWTLGSPQRRALSLENPPSNEEAICCRGDLFADMRVLCTSRPRSALCVCNLRPPEMKPIRVRNILGPFAGCAGKGCPTELGLF